MKENEKNNNLDTSGIGDKVLEKTTAAYKWWNRLATLNADDPVWLSVMKITVRIIGILIFLALSPFMILGLLLGFTAAL